MTIKPNLKRVGRGRAAAFVARTVVGAAGRMRFDRIGFTERDVDATAVGFPARNARREMLVRIGDALVNSSRYSFSSVSGFGSRRRQKFSIKFSRSSSVVNLLERFFFIFGNDVSDVFADPVFINFGNFFFYISRLSSDGF
jgi:hypothetical protein